MSFSSDLLDAMSHKCVLMEKMRIPDGAGGYITAWKEGAEFINHRNLDTATEALIAEQQGVTALYELLVDKDFPIEYNDAFKDLKTGQTYRVTMPTNEKVTPDFSAMNYKYFRAERWTLPT